MSKDQKALLLGFVRESNRIEGIHREPTPFEINATDEFLGLHLLTVVRLRDLVSVYQPNAALRDRPGRDVRVGNHYPPPGSPEIRFALEDLLEKVNENEQHPYLLHCEYETLHPFTDGNGRSGRAIWLWQMTRAGGAPLGFLHTWYYQSLQHSR